MELDKFIQKVLQKFPTLDSKGWRWNTDISQKLPDVKQAAEHLKAELEFRSREINSEKENDEIIQKLTQTLLTLDSKWKKNNETINQLQHVKQKAEDLKKQLQAKTHESEEKTETIHQLQQLEQAAETLKIQLESKNQQMIKSEMEKDEFIQKLMETFPTLESKWKENTDIIYQLQEVKETAEKLKQLGKKNQELQGETYSEIIKQLQQMKDKAENLKKQMESINWQMLWTEKTRNEETDRKLKELVKQLEEKKNKTEETLNELSGNISQAQEDKQKMERLNNELESTKQQLQQEKKAAENLKKQLEEKNRELSGNTSQAQEEKQKMERLRNELESTNQQLQQEKQAAENLKKQLEEKNRELSGNISQAQKEKQKMKSEMERLRNELYSRNQQLQQEKQAAENLKKQLEEKNRELEKSSKKEDMENRVKAPVGYKDQRRSQQTGDDEERTARGSGGFPSQHLHTTDTTQGRGSNDGQVGPLPPSQQQKNRPQKDDIILVEVNGNYNYICLRNTSSEDKLMTGWEIKLQNKDRKLFTYKFQESFTLKAGEGLTLHRFTDKRGPYPDNAHLMWTDITGLYSRDNVKISLISNTGEEHRLM